MAHCPSCPEKRPSIDALNDHVSAQHHPLYQDRMVELVERKLPNDYSIGIHISEKKKEITNA